MRQAVGKFEKVSFDQFVKGAEKTGFTGDVQAAYEAIVLPERATAGSAGYDFCMPYDIRIAPGQSVLVATGIRVKMDPAYVFLLFPRSSLGFKYRLRLDNTVGVIDSDYYQADNEGHIFARMTNESDGKMLELSAGQAFMQGIFVPFGISEDDDVSTKRIGGFGSTDRKE